MKTTLRDYLHAINVLADDIDVSVDGTEFSIAVCTPIKLTPLALERFTPALDTLCVDVEENGHLIYSERNEDYEDYDSDADGLLADACTLLSALAGYCSTSRFEQWFEGDNATLI